MKGLTTPLSCWLRCSCLFVQVRGTFEEPPTGLIPWFSKTEGNTYATLLHHPFLFKGKTNACSRGSKKDFWCRFQGGLRSCQDIPSTIENSSPSHLHHLPFAYRFPLPHFTLAVLFALSFPFASLFRLTLVCLFALMALPKNTDLHLRRLEEIELNIRSFMTYNLSIIISLQTSLKNKKALWST